MAKTTTTICINPEVLLLAQAKIKNMSAFIENILRIETELPHSMDEDKQAIISLKLINAKLLQEINELKKEREKDSIEIKALKVEIKKAKDEHDLYKGREVVRFN